MRQFGWQIRLGVILVVCSAGLFLVQFLLFGQPRDTLYYLLQDLAFLPLQVLLVTLLLNAYFTRREKEALLQKMNMVIGTFFSEMGHPLMRALLAFDGQARSMRRVMQVRVDWSDTDYAEAQRHLRAYTPAIALNAGDLEALARLLAARRGFLLSLLENPNLLEHETFTEMLWAICHLNEELAFRDNLRTLPPADVRHLEGDIERAYRLVLAEWLEYTRHLRDHYPYIFSLIVRTNPFDPQASPVVAAPITS